MHGLRDRSQNAAPRRPPRDVEQESLFLGQSAEREGPMGGEGALGRGWERLD